MRSMLHTKETAREGRKRRGKIEDGINTPYNRVARGRRREEEERSRMKSTLYTMKKKNTYMIVILAVMKKKL